VGHQFLYPCIIWWCRLRCKPRVNGFFDLVFIVEPLVTKERFQMQKHMIVTWREVWAEGGRWSNCSLSKYCDEILRCGGSVWAGIVMKYHNTLTKHDMLLVLDRTTQFLKCVSIDTCIDCWALRQEFHKQNAFSVSENCAHDLVSFIGGWVDPRAGLDKMQK
jgi:hypothetical protein